MDITIHSAFLPHNDPDASLFFYRDTLGFKVTGDVGYDGIRWITVSPADPDGTFERVRSRRQPDPHQRDSFDTRPLIRFDAPD